MILILKHLAATCRDHTGAVVFIIIFIYVPFDDIIISRSSQSALCRGDTNINKFLIFRVF